MIIDAGAIGPDYQPGHAHADTLSFELSSGPQRIIVDSGTSCYGTGPERLRQRGTAAHNTVSIDGLNSSEVWSGFRVARRARITERKSSFHDDSIILNIAHNGFNRIKGVKDHSRKFKIEANTIEITDIIDGRGKHLIESFMHFHPNIDLNLENDVIIGKCSNNITFKIILDDKLQSFFTDSTYHPEFGLSLKNKKLVMSTYAFLPITFSTTIEL